MSTPTPDGQPLLQVRDLAKRFGDLQAVDGLSFEIAHGETFGLLGPNGAGKTTTIAMICGLLAADAGTVSVAGTPIRPDRVAGRELIGFVPQELALYPDLSGRDNLQFFGRLYGLRGTTAARRIADVLDIVGLADRAGDRVDTYSGGMQRRLNIAAGMLHSPRLLILDEPTVGIDPQSRNAILDAVAHLGQSGMSVLYTTHYMEEAERLCRRVGIVDQGKLLAVGTRRELIARVGEQDQLVITTPQRAAEAAALLADLASVRSAVATDLDTVTCAIDDAARELADVVAALTGAALPVANVQVREPSLDSVFLAITGTALRD